MGERFVTRGFVGRREDPGSGPTNGDERRRRTPPGQYLTTDFPVLSAGPTPRTRPDQWSFTIEGLVSNPIRWTWEQFLALPSRDWVVDISCVTKWTHLDMRWKGVSVDTLLEGVSLDPKAAFAIAYADGGYTTNLPLADILNNQAFVAWEYDGKPLAPEHGGPARLVVPARYFWKSAKWVRGLRIQSSDSPDSGNPWATTTGATNGWKNGTRATDGHRVAACDGQCGSR